MGKLAHKSEFHFFRFCILGPALPYPLFDSAMAKSPDDAGVLLFGGNDGGVEEDRILELRAGADSWTTLNIKLQEKRDGHVVIPCGGAQGHMPHLFWVLLLSKFCLSLYTGML